MDNNEKKRQNDNNQPKMPKFNMNWIYTVILISLGILFITGGGDALAVGSSANRKPHTQSSRSMWRKAMPRAWW